MHRSTLALVALLFVAASAAPADARGPYRSTDFGIGLTLGSPVGIDAKFGVGGGHSLAATIGAHFIADDFLGFAFEWNWAFYQYRIQATTNALYLGVGAVLSFLHDDVFRDDKHDDDDGPIGIGLYVPFGTDFVFKSVPINLFVEIGPGFEAHPGDADLLFNIAVGIRFMP